MPANGKNRINFQVGFNVDKASLNQVQQAFKKIQDIKPTDFSGTRHQLVNIKRQALDVSNALSKAFNPSLNSINLSTFKKQLGNLSMNKIYQDFNKLGAVGQNAFNSMSTSILTTNLNLKQTSNFIQNMGTTLMNTAKWTVASGAIRAFTSSISQAFSYVKSLDSSLNDIRIVTKDSADEMANFAAQANRAATELGRSTLDYTKAALTFYQQGLNDEQVQARTEATLKAQNITGAGAQMADYLTAVWNGYKVANEQAELYVDKLAAVADSSASNMSQLAVAMSKVASSANLLGVPVDNLNAQIATIVSTTRQAPESVGNALKTIYARINDIVTGADDAEVSFGNYSKQMAAVGISTLDANGRLRDTGDIIDEIGGKWQTLSHEQQIYLARTMAGQRQYNNLLALFENWGKYTDLLNVSLESQGATAEKNSIYLESLAAHMEQLGAAQQRLKSSMVDTDSYKDLIDIGTQGITLLANFIQSIGGGGNALLMLGSIFTQVFSGTIAKEINGVITNMRNVRDNAQIVENAIAEINRQAQVGNGSLTASRQLQSIKDLYGTLNEQQRNYLNNLLIVQTKEENQLNTTKQNLEEATKLQNTLAKKMNIKLDVENTQSFDKFYQNINNVENGLLDLEVPLEMVNKNVRNLKNQDVFDNLLYQTMQFQDSLGETNPLVQKLYNILEKIQDTPIENTLDLSKLRKQLFDTINELNGQVNIVNQDNVKQTTQNFTQAQQAVKRATQATARFKEALRSQANIQGIIKGIAGLGQFASGIRSIVSLYDVWNNKNLSVGQKILQTMTSLSTGAGMLISSFGNLRKAGSSIVSIFTTYGQKVLAVKAAQDAQIAGNIKEAVTSKAVTEADIAQAAAKSGVSVEAFKAAMAEAQKTGMDEAQALAATQAALANQALAAGLHAVWGAMKPFLIGGAIVAGIIAIGVAIANIQSDLEKAKEQADRLNQVAKDNYSNFSNISSIIRTISSDFSQLAEAETSLSKLTSGTEQWANQLGNVNQQVTELLQKYPQLKDYLTIGQNGQLGFREGAQEEVERSLKQQRTVAAASYVSSQRSANQANNKVLIEQLKQSIKETTGVRSSDISEGINKTLEIIQQYGISILEDEKEFLHAYAPGGQLENPEVYNAILDAKASIVELNSTIYTNNQKTDNLIAAMVKSSTDFTQFAEYNNISNEKGQQAFQRAFANRVSNLDQSSLDSKYFDTRITNMQTGQTEHNLNMDRVVEAFQNQLRENFNDAAIKLTQSEDGESWTYQYAGQIHTLTKQGIISGLAYYQNESDISKEIAERIQGLLRLGDQNALIFAEGKDSLQHLDISNLTQQEIDKLRSSAANYQEQVGASTQEIRDALEKAQNNLEINFNNFVESLPKSVQNAFEKINTKGYSDTAKRAIADLLNDALETEDIQNFNLAQKLVQSLDTSKQADAFAELTSTINWSTISVDEFKQKMTEAGVDTGLSNVQLAAFIEYQKQLAGVTKSTTEAYKQLHDISDKIKTGDVIDDQAYSTLITADSSLGEFFIHAAEGGYQLIGVADQFKNKVNQISLQGLEDQLESIENRRNIINNTDIKTRDSTQQLNYLEASGINTTDWQIRLNQGDLSALQEIQDAFDKLALSPEKVKESLKRLNQEELVTQQRLASTAESAEQLEKLYRKGKISIQVYQKAIKQFNKQLDKDVNKEKWESLSDYFSNTKVEGYSERFKEDRDAAQDLAEQLLRFSSAVETVKKNYKEWSQILGHPEKYNEAQQALVKSEAANVYADTLGVDTSIFGDDFLGNVENLELLNTVLTGTKDQSIEAYNELQKLAYLNIITQVGLNTDDFDAAYISIKSDIDDFVKENNIEIGAKIDNEGFIEALNEILAASSYTKDQAQAILKSFGVKAELKPLPFRELPGIQVPRYKTIADYTSENGNPEQQVDGFRIMYKTVFDGYDNVTEGMKIPGGWTIGGSLYRDTDGGAKYTPTTPSSSGGGGGGSSSKPSQAKTNTSKRSTVKKEKTYDPYEKVTKAYEKQSHILDRLQKQQDKLTGKDRLNNLQKQNKTLEKQNALLRKRQQISDRETTRNTTAWFKKQLTSNDTIKDVIQFDNQGRVTNTSAILNAAVDAYNKAIKASDKKYNNQLKNYNNWIEKTYNKAKTKDDQEKLEKEKESREKKLKEAEQTAKNEVQIEEKKYKQIEEYLKEYERTWQDDFKAQQDWIQNLEQLIENKLSKAKIVVDLAIDTGNLERDFLDFQDKFIKPLKDEDLWGQAQSNARKMMSYFDSKEIIKTRKAMDDTRKTIDKLQKANEKTNSNTLAKLLGISKEDVDKLKKGATLDGLTLQDLIDNAIGMNQQKMREYFEQLSGQLEEVQQYVDSIKENYLSAIDTYIDAMDKHIEQYDRVDSIIEHARKMGSMMFGDYGFEQSDKLYTSQIKNFNRQTEVIAKYRDELEKKLSKARTEEEKEKYKEQIEELNNQIRSNLENVIDAITARYEARMDHITQTALDTLYGGNGQLFANEQWDDIQAYDKDFLDRVESTLGIDQIERLYQGAIDGVAGNVAEQNKLKKVMNDQLKILREKEHLTQYDLDRAKAVLQVEQARMALEDARNQKNTMRLRRDSQGNYTYQYVADEEKLDDLQQKLADAQLNLYQSDKQHYIKNLNEIQQATEDYAQRRKQLEMEYQKAKQAGDQQAIDNIKARMDLLDREHQKRMEGLLEDNQTLIGIYLPQSYGDALKLDGDLLTTMKNDIPGMSSSIQQLADNLIGKGGLVSAFKDMTNQFNIAGKNWASNVKNALDKAGLTTDDYKNGLASAIKEITDEIPEYKKIVSDTEKQIENIGKLLQQTDSFLEKVRDSSKLVADMVKAYNELASLNETSSKDAGSGTALTYDQPTTRDSLIATINKIIKNFFKENKAVDKIAGYATGGYTGTWGEEGKLAFLHQKELVLNAEDTSNLLKAVYLVKDLTANMQIGKELSSLQRNQKALFNNMMNNHDILDQNVHIEASFPNVRDHQEIEQAFNNLVNMASMYASKRED